MFTGIIEETGMVKEVQQEGGNRRFWIASPIWNELKTDQSLSHDGVCLTVEEVKDGMHRVTAVAETLSKTTMGNWLPGTRVNLERCMPLNGRLDGHIVQGHADGTAVCTAVSEKNGSWEYHFEFDEKFAPLIIEKGSVAVNGISLTCFGVTRTGFRVAIIPFTYQHTNISALQEGASVNLEFDVIGKYVARIMQTRN